MVPKLVKWIIIKQETKTTKDYAGWGKSQPIVKGLSNSSISVALCLYALRLVKLWSKVKSCQNIPFQHQAYTENCLSHGIWGGRKRGGSYCHCTRPSACCLSAPHGKSGMLSRAVLLLMHQPLPCLYGSWSHSWGVLLHLPVHPNQSGLWNPKGFPQRHKENWPS